MKVVVNFYLFLIFPTSLLSSNTSFHFPHFPIATYKKAYKEETREKGMIDKRKARIVLGAMFNY